MNRVNEAVVLLYGGIGNQLFQYIFGEYLKFKFGLNVTYDLSSFGVLPTYRSYQLDIVVKEIPQFATNKFFFSRYAFLKRRFLRSIFEINPNVKYYNELRDVIIESDFSKNKRKLQYFEGYWQNNKYINWLQQNVHFDLLDSNFSIPPEILNDYNYIISHRCISVHIRRGDYLNKKNAAIMALCSIDYYIKGVEYILEFFPDSNIVLFSDDMEWVKENFKINRELYYVKDKGINPFWDIFLMSKCQHNVMSNSTFSWWGAILNSYSDKIVIAPKQWFNHSDNPELYNDNWILLDNHPK